MSIVTKIGTALALASILATALGGCESVDRPAMSTLVPGADPAHWTFEAVADVVYPENSPSAEAARRRWLATTLAFNDACPNGFAVERRRRVMTNRTVLGVEVWRVYYDVACEGAVR
jgi:hypothetical protein